MYHNHDGGGPGMLYNGMVAPIAPYGIRGVLWYQGETNCGDKQYDIRMKALIAGWRQEWGLGDFPFYFVQLAPFHYDNDNPTKLPEMWRLQTAAMLTIPNTGMVVINDVAPPNNIHPQNKREVGQRLALWALAKTYGFTNLEYSGPLFKALTIDGNKARISFTHATGGLASRDGKALGWITIAGADHVFVPATAVIDGETLVVSAPSVSQPVAVRYAWDQDAQPNLMNKSGLPAPAFDSDTWPGR
jgi:sialate O-acetylesterase